jgi:hypothetical protein
MATLFDEASLVMIPSGYKDDKLYSIKPTSGDGDFTFSRDGSGASPATRVNSAGLIEKGRTNEFLQSNTFSTSWTLGASSVSGGQSGYDGTNDAWELIEDTNNNQHYVQQAVATVGSVETVSVYAKANTRDWLVINQAGIRRTYYDLANGVMGTIDGNVIDATITSVGDGWYRCTYTANMGYTAIRIGVTTGDGVNAYTGDGSSSIYIQDAQLEKGLVATSVIETTTAAASAGILGDMPRLDYSGGASCPSLLLEPARTNLVTQSEYLANTSVWPQTRSSITTNVAISPEGVQNASKIISDATNNSHYIRDTFSSTTGVCSVFAKADDFTFLKLATNAHSFSPTYFNLTNGVITKSLSYDADIEDYGNGWYRCIIKPTDPITNFFIENAGDSASATHLGDGVKGVFIYGAQVESGSYPTSYVPCYGSATARAADVTLGQSISLGNSHTIFFNGELNTIDNNKVFMELITSSVTTSATIRNVIGTLRLYNQIDGNYPLGGIQSDNNKWVMRIDGTAYTLFYNNAGSPASQSGTFATARDMDKINLKGAFTESTTKQILAFNSALTDAECNSLVS